MNTSISPISVGGRHSSDLEGHIQVIFGPMFSGKTTELMRRIRRYTHANKRCQVIKYKNDTRYDDEMASTHDMQKCVARGCNKLSELAPESLADVDVIGIDEGQFFTDCVYYADLWASQGKVVIVAALDATFERKPFGHILELIPVSEQVMKLNAVCMLCHREASFTKRIGSETAVEVIGGADKYLSTCRECFEKPADSPKQQASPHAHVLQNCSPLPSPMLSAADAEALAAPLPSTDAADEEISSLPRAALSNNKRISVSSAATAPASSPSRLRSIDTHNKAMGEEVNKKRKNVEGSEQDEKRQMLDNKENMRQAVC